jgi:PhnB protein
MAVKPIPDNYPRVTPYLVVDGAAAVIDFAIDVFGATERGGRFTTPDGKVGHAEFMIGDSVVMCADASTSDQGRAMPAVLNIYVEDVDAVYRKALDAGATSLREPADQFFGDRSAGVEDAAGNQWWMATHVEDMPPEEMAKRAAAAQSS